MVVVDTIGAIVPQTWPNATEGEEIVLGMQEADRSSRGLAFRVDDIDASVKAARFVRTIRRWRSRAISGSGRPSTIAWAEAARLSIEARWRRQPADRVAAAVASGADSMRLAVEASRIRKAFEDERPMFRDSAQSGIIHGLAVQWVSPEELIVNSRTGKLKRVIDERKAQEGKR